MRFILVIVISLVVVIAGAGGYLALQGRRLILSEEPVSLPAIEQALADDSLLGLAYLDIAAVSRLDRLYQVPLITTDAPIHGVRST